MFKKLFFLVIALGLLFTPHSYAELVCTHGSAGQFQTPEKEPSGTCRFGWGLDFRIEGTKNRDYDWIHYSIPVSSENVYLNIEIGYYMQWRSIIRHVHVWDGARPVQYFNDINEYGAGRGSWGHLTLKLKTPVKFQHGLGISILVGAIYNYDDFITDPTVRIIIESVCVH